MSLQKLNYINFTQKELDELFTSALEGNPDSFRELSGYVRNISESYFLSKYRQGKITNKEDIDDLANNVYLTFARQYQKIDNLEYWLRRVLFLNFINWYKKNKSKKTVSIDEVYNLREEKEVNPGDSVDAQKILSILDTLSSEKQQIIRFRFYEDLKFAEIAEKLSKTEDAVKKMFYRTIEELKNKL